VAQKGFVFRKGASWFLKYRERVSIDNKITSKQKCVFLASYNAGRYRRASDLADLVVEKMEGVRQANKCPKSSENFVAYVEEIYLPFALENKKPSTYAGYLAYWTRYIKPRVEGYALRDFTVAVIAGLLKDIAAMHRLNIHTITKVRSVLSAVFS
jgi:hypothetical protein